MTLEIMMPFYGRPDHLKIAVESVLAQSDPDWRLTVIDDQYPDPTAGKWVAGLGDKRVRYIRNTQNLRTSGNFNKSVSLTREPFVTIMGCDDVMLPDYVARVSQIIATHPNADIIQPGVSVIDEHGEHSRPLADRVKAAVRGRLRGMTTFSGERVVASLLLGNWTYFPSLVWRTELIAKFSFRTDLDVVQDLAMTMNILISGGTLVADDEIVFNYRRHSVSYSAITGVDGTKFAQERQLFSEIAARCNGLGWVSSARTAQMRLLSRANAFMELPRALAKRDFAAIRNLARHVFL
jgi:glycosyltransferase involved in cell wall biosynthesis